MIVHFIVECLFLANVYDKKNLGKNILHCDSKNKVTLEDLPLHQQRYRDIRAV